MRGFLPYPMRMFLAVLLGIYALFLLKGCRDLEEIQGIDSQPYDVAIPEGFPELPIPEGNQLTKARVELGKKLFFDPILSRDSSISCASCHKQSAAFTDGRRLSMGIEGRLGTRNSPSLVNVAYGPYFFFEGGSPSLEAQVMGPIETFHEMDFNVALLNKRLQGHPVYESMAQKAYGMNMKIHVVISALASFERTLIGANSPYDKYVNGKSEALSPQEVRGLDLFFGKKTNCASCHPAPLFTDFSLQNIGLKEAFDDKGRFRISLDSADIGKFKTPSLRNIALTPPYMHNGSMQSLEQVIDHFNEGGMGHTNQHPLVRPLGLTAQDKEDLIAFLNALTDRDVLSKPEWAP